MVGGLGNDTYTVDNVLDVVTENAGEGTDLVNSSIAYALSTDVENLTLTGTAATSGTGNDSDNVLIGNNAANTLTGGAGNDTLNGGAGSDTLLGGSGDDVYIVDVVTDVVRKIRRGHGSRAKRDHPQHCRLCQCRESQAHGHRSQ
jgi:Ca2+-binding RTX toxin-like protein